MQEKNHTGASKSLTGISLFAIHTKARSKKENIGKRTQVEITRSNLSDPICLNAKWHKVFSHVCISSMSVIWLF